MRSVATTVAFLTLLAACSSDDGPAVETGTIQVAVVTEGANTDPDGFTVRIGNGAPQSITSDAELTSPALRAGTYEVLLSGLADDCTPVGANPRSVEVTAGAPVQVTFNVNCVGFATVTIGSTTTGAGAAPGGYGLSLQNSARLYSFDVPASGASVPITVVAGTYQFSVYAQGNCRSLQANPQVVSVTSGAPLTVPLSMQCDLPRQFAAVRGSGAEREIVVQASDETGFTVLTNNAQADYDPAWSPDGARIAFTSERTGAPEIYVMNADGSSVQQLTDGQPSASFQPTWSPDGLRIAFVGTTRDGKQDIYVMAADGTDPIRITEEGTANTEPAWTPIGDRILFVRRTGTARAILTMNADGSGTAQLTSATTTDVSPAWAPSGARIAFMRQVVGGFQLHVMNADGTGDVALAAGPGIGLTRSSWGTNDRIAYGTATDDGYGGNYGWIEAVSPDGTGRNGLLGSGDYAYAQPAWRP